MIKNILILCLFAFVVQAEGDDKKTDTPDKQALEAKQKEWKEKLIEAQKAGRLELKLPNVKESLVFIYIKPDKYKIGITEKQREFLFEQSGEPMIAHNIANIRTIELKEGFFILDREMTMEAWEACYTDKPTKSQLPVRDAPWFICIQCCFGISNCLNLNVRLPSELEWEIAARCGDERLLPYTNDVQSVFSTKDKKEKTVVTALNVNNVKDKTPNNIFNLSDNVSEWCLDEYRNQFFDFIDNDNGNIEIKYCPSTFPQCFIEEDKNLYPKESSTLPKARTYRGGSYQDKDYNRLIPIRRSGLETDKLQNVGFRLVIPCDAWNWSPPKKEEPKEPFNIESIKEFEKIINNSRIKSTPK